MKRLLYTILISFCLFTTVWADGSSYATKSALADGRWKKIKVAENGIYKLTFTELKKMGFSQPEKVSVHGYGGWPLDESFRKPYVDDVPAVAVWKGPDYLLFYAKGPIKWEYDPTIDKSIDKTNELANGFVHTNNPYSNYGCYFLTDATPVKEMQAVPSETGATLKISSFDDYWLHEVDQVSVNKSGRELYGESFMSKLVQDFTATIPGITHDKGYATLSFIAKPTSGSGKVTMSVDGSRLLSGDNGTISYSPATDEYTKARPLFRKVEWPGNKNETVKVNIQYGQTGHKNVYLDYIRLQMTRKLQPYGAYTFFRSLVSIGNSSRFVIGNANANTLIFDVTDGLNPKRMEATLSGAELSFSIPAGALREFVAVQIDKAFPSPEPFDTNDVAPQNLHGLPQTDMIIIAQPGMEVQAERLADAHRSPERDGLTVEVVSPEAIYNEFSSGTPDATAYRRFMKMFYDRKTSDADAPKYLLLFGDGAYDNRGLTTDWKKTDMSNMLLTYQTVESLNAESFVVDDYYGFLQDTSGEDIVKDALDLGIGRFPIRTQEEAKSAVNKVISYMDNKETGNWKNKVCFVADDGNNSDKFMTLHMKQANDLAEYIEKDHPEFLVNKIYFDAYKKDFTGGNTRYPDVSSGIKKQLKDGLLLINYTGHGGTEAWSDEAVLTQADILQSTYTRLPIWITATCDFTRFDDPVTSAGEDVFLNKISGGIALFTTTRVAYSSPNFVINDKLIRNLFEKKNGRTLTLGEVMKETKKALSVSSPTHHKLGFSLIGDPAMKLTYPEYRMRVTTVNGESSTGEPVAFKALAKMTIEGEVLNLDGNVAIDFNGILNPTVLDSRDSVKTLDNNKGEDGAFQFVDYLNTLFIGNDSVRNGKFSFTFTVPKDISYSNKAGKMNLYATDETSGNEAQGAFLNFRVGGTAENAEKDTIGPEIRALYLNDSTFVEGGKVNTTPFFVAELWDQTGVNISGSSIGHDIMLIIDNQPSLSYNLNNYYETIPGKEGEGLVRFLIPALSPGVHTAEFWVWDIQNQSTLRTFTFEVVEGLKPYIMNLIATPVPARENVTFYLYHNRPESRLKVGIMVYDMTGRLQWKHEENGSSDLFNAYSVTWNLTNNRGGRLRPGVYLYRAAISTDQSKEATETKKLIILAQ